MNEYQTGHVATWLGQHDNTIRVWARRWGKHLSPSANRGRRRFTDGDVLVLATVARYRQDGLSLDAIDKLLNEGNRIDPADLPSEPTPEVQQARQETAIIAMPRDTYLLDMERQQVRIEALETEIQRLEAALEKATDERGALQNQLMEVTGQLEAARARVDVIDKERPTATYWLAVIVGVVIAAILVTAGVTLLATGN